MAEEQLTELVRNVDTRLARVEQYLPTLATREELRAAGAPLATREGMDAAIQAAVAPLATREELQEAIRAAIAPLATREELRAAVDELRTEIKAEIKEEGERSRRYTNVLIEDLRDDNRLILEHLIALSARVDALAQR
jgi:hypothetical protein